MATAIFLPPAPCCSKTLLLIKRWSLFPCPWTRVALNECLNKNRMGWKACCMTSKQDYKWQYGVCLALFLVMPTLGSQSSCWKEVQVIEWGYLLVLWPTVSVEVPAVATSNQQTCEWMRLQIIPALCHPQSALAEYVAHRLKEHHKWLFYIIDL